MRSSANTASKLTAALFALLLAALPAARAQQSIANPSGGGGGGMQTNASNATLPAARNNLGFVNYASIMDPTFGAACDAVTNDAAAIQAAANSLPASGGVLLIPAGKTCNFNSTISLQNSMTVKSDGGQSAQLFWGGNATDDHIVVSNRTGPFQAAGVRFVAAAGSGFVVNDTITLNDSCGTHAVLTVAAVSAGGVTDARITTAGSCVSAPSQTVAVAQLSTSGVGVNATFMMFYGSSAGKVNNFEMKGLVIGSNTTMTNGCVLRSDLTYLMKVEDTRFYGNNKVWQGACITRAFSTYMGPGWLIDTTKSAALTLSGTDDGANHSADLFLNNSQILSCNQSVATVAAAKLTGCIIVGDHTGGVFVNHTEVVTSVGYALYFATTIKHNSGTTLAALAYLNDFNVDGVALPAAGGVSGTNWADLFISGNTWLGGQNMDAMSFGSGWDGVHFDPSTMVHVAQTDGSTPNGIYINGINMEIRGEIVGYSAAAGLGAGVYLDSASSVIDIGGRAVIRQFNNGVQGNAAVGVYSLNATLRANVADLTGISCAAFSKPAQVVSSAGASLCPIATTDLSDIGTFNLSTTGSGAFKGTTLPTQAAGTLGLSGIASAPTLAANGEGDVYLSTTGGLTLQGQGSTNDFSLSRADGTLVASILHNGRLVFATTVNGYESLFQGASLSEPGYFAGLNTEGFTRVALALDSTSDTPYVGFGPGSGARDTFFSRASAGVMQFGTTTTNALGSLNAATATLSATAQVGSTAAALGGSTTMSVYAGGITLGNTNNYYAGNLYFNSGWKYVGNGSGMALGMAASSGHSMEFDCAPNNSGGAGAAATPVVCAYFDSVTNGLSLSASLQIGASTLTLSNGELGGAKITASGTAPGAAGAKEAWVCGTNAGTAKRIAYGGTSTTPVTIVDNVGAGVTGC